MSLRELVCVVCPNGCPLRLEISEEKPAKLLSLSGQGCPRGEIWARQEIENPLRTIASIRTQTASAMASLGWFAGSASASLDDPEAHWNRHAAKPAVVMALLAAAFAPNLLTAVAQAPNDENGATAIMVVSCKYIAE